MDTTTIEACRIKTRAYFKIVMIKNDKSLS